MTASVKYSGRVYEFVGYDSTVTLPSGSTLEQLGAAIKEAREEMLRQHPTARIDSEKIEVGWGYQPPLIAVVRATVKDSC